MAEELDRERVVVTVSFEKEIYRKLEDLLKKERNFHPYKELSIHDIINEQLKESFQNNKGDKSK